MARKRQFDPEYPFEEEIALLSIPARYFYMLSWCHMDDTNGVLPYNIYKLKGQIFPEDNIDVQSIILELLKLRRLFEFEAGGKKWLWCPTLLKHQVINNPSRKKYPDPPKKLQEDYRSGKLALTLSRVERVERVDIKDQATPEFFNKPTEEQKEELAKLHILLKDRINIFNFMARIRKQKGYFPPVEAIIKIGQQALKTQPANFWGYFVEALKKELPGYFADLNIKEHEKYKNEPVIIGDLLVKQQ